MIEQEWLNILSWFMNFFGIMGALEASKNQNKASLLKMNIFFGIQNAYLLFYFVFTLQYAFILLQLVFLCFSIKGIIENSTKKRNIIRYQDEIKIISN
jgi:hypothetical protein